VNKKELLYKWVLILYIMGVSFYGMKELIVQQLLSRANAYKMAGEDRQAIRICKKAIMIDRKNAIVWDTLGYLYQLNGELIKSVEAYREAVMIDPELKRALLNLGVILVVQEKYKEAVPYFEHIRVLGPEDSVKSILAYHRMSLQMLIQCYEALQETDKKDKLINELQQYYPESHG